MGNGSSPRRIAAAATIAAACALVIAPAAGAKTLRTGYKPTSYTPSVKHTGLCLESLTCPAVSNSSVSAKPGNYQHTQLGSLLGVGATTVVTWTSGPFTYTGAEGKRSRDVRLVMRRRADTGSLLDVAGNTATYSLNLVSARTGNTVAEGVHNAQNSPAANWTRTGPAQVAGAVRKGRSYKIEVQYTFTNGAQVIPGATSDFKKARLVARR
jgi:hypothetical protein